VGKASALGSASTVKLAVNSLLAIQVAAVAELLGIIRRSGFDTTRAFEVITSTAVISPAAKIAAGAMLAGNYSPLFPIELVEKDLGYAINVAKHLGALSPISEATLHVFQTALERGHGNDNITGVAKLYH